MKLCNLCLLVEVLRPVAAKEYVVVYLNTKNSNDYVYQLDLGWVREELMMLPHSFRKNLAQVVVLHPDVWFKYLLTSTLPCSQGCASGCRSVACSSIHETSRNWCMLIQ